MARQNENARCCIFLAVFITVFAGAQRVYALPAVNQYIKDESGEYVYYIDKTFNRTSYAGFLFYDDGSYAMRYYAPADAEKQLGQKAVEILFSIDPDKDHIEMTGERFLTAISPDDSEIVNYLHDMMYELASRRQTAGDISPQNASGQFKNVPFFDYGAERQQDFMQFGGRVKILFDWCVPIFNLKSITSSDGKVLFQAVTAGRLQSATDTSFSQFTGIPEKLLDSSHQLWQPKKTKKTIASYTTDNLRQSLALDSDWTASMDRMWFLGDCAYAALSSMRMPAQNEEYYKALLLRRLILGVENSYSVWSSLDVQQTGDKLSVSCLYYQNKEANITRDYKTITKATSDGENGMYGWFSLTVFDSVYNANKRYFDNIIKSYSIKTIK